MEKVKIHSRYRGLKVLGAGFLLVFAAGSLILLLRSFAERVAYDPKPYCVDHVTAALYSDGSTQGVASNGANWSNYHDYWLFTAKSDAGMARVSKCLDLLGVSTTRTSGRQLRIGNYPQNIDFNALPTELSTKTDVESYRAFLATLIESDGSPTGRVASISRTETTPDGVLTNAHFGQRLQAIQAVTDKVSLPTYWTAATDCKTDDKPISEADIKLLTDDDPTNDPADKLALCVKSTDSTAAAVQSLPLASCRNFLAELCVGANDTFVTADAAIKQQTDAKTARTFRASKQATSGKEYEKLTNKKTSDLLYVGLHYDDAKSSPLSITSTKRYQAFEPKTPLTGGGAKAHNYTIALKSADGKVLKSRAFQLGPQVQYSDPALGPITATVQSTLNQVDSSVLIPWDQAAQQIVITDDAGKTVASQSVAPVANAAPPASPASYSVVTSDGSTADMQFGAGAAPAGKFTIAVVGDDYPAGTSDFANDVNTFTNVLFATEPYKSRRSQINIAYAYDSAVDLGCAHDYPAIPRVIHCNYATITSFLAAKGIPHDAIAVIYNNSVYGGFGNPDQYGVASRDSLTPYTLVHELGHAIYYLQDEYTYTDGSGVGVQGVFDGSVHTNCYNATPPYSGWDIALKSYNLGCSSANWYRPDTNGIMYSQTAGYFSQPSIDIIDQKLDSVAGAFSDSVAPTVSISAPTAGSTVGALTTLQVNASDNAGVVRVAYYVDNVMQGTSYLAPFSLNWTPDGIAPGTHSLKAKAVDAKGNVTYSSPVSFTVGTVKLSVIINYPVSAYEVLGTVQMSLTTGGSQAGSINQYKLFVDGNLVKTATNPAFNWNSTTTTDGVHSIYVRVSDPAGDTADSPSVSVTVHNSTTPVVTPTATPTPVVTPTPTPGVTPTRTPTPTITPTIEPGTPTATPSVPPVGGTDTTPPTVNIISPSSGDRVQGAAFINIDANDASGIYILYVYVDGALLGSFIGHSPFITYWSTQSTTDGVHYISAIAYDASTNHNQGISSTVAVTVDNVADSGDTNPPTVPTGVTLVDKGPRSAIIAWNDSTDPENNLNSYNIYANGVYNGSIDAPTAAYYLTNLLPQTTYTLQVSAVDKAGNESALSSGVTLTTDADATAGGVVGDINGNGKVEIQEALQVISWWRSQTNVTAGRPDGDTSGNNLLEMSEVLQVLKNWQTGS